jgi:transcriptional regulator with XRE-family HTH domain
MNFAEKIKLVRTELKLSQEDLARELGVKFKNRSFCVVLNESGANERTKTQA